MLLLIALFLKAERPLPAEAMSMPLLSWANGSPRLGGGKSVWWTWTAPTSGTVEINTFGSDYDTVLKVYQGTSVDSLRRIASNDDSGSLQSQVTFTAAQGESYQIAVDGYRGASGSIALAVCKMLAN